MSQPDRLPSHLVDHDVAQGATQPSSGPAVRYELKPARRPDGRVAEGLYAAWITLDNPAQYNSYTTEMAKEVVLSFRRASNARDVVAVVFTGAGDRAFCTGGNTKEYAEYYAGRPAEYAAYMRLFNDMVSAILLCDKPVICRVNGMRVGGGQEIGMACDFSVASDLANFGQAGPRHGSAPVGGSTDFLPLYVGVERAMFSVTLCQPWSAYRAADYGLITEAVPVLRVDDEVIPNPLVVSDRWLERGRVVYGDFKTGAEAAAGKDLLKRGVTDLRPLDAAVERLVSSLLMTFPGCVEKTVSEIRKHKLAHWDANKESNRAWLALNMLSEANAGFRAFNEGPKDDREADFVLLRQRIAKGEAWSDELIEAILPKGRGDRAGEVVGEHPLTVDVREGGQVLHLLLDAPKANVLDGRMLAGISAALDRHGESARLKAIVFEGAGVHFSFGASVPEHTRERAGAMLAQLHGLMRRLLALGVPTAAVVRGQCLGGGLELAGFCSWVFASPTAAFGQPEIRLAVFPPFASVLLPWRLGGGRALDLCVSGRSIDAQTALAWGLAHAVVDDPSAACARFLAEEILPKSASSLRRAERAARGELARLVEHALPGLERDYLEDLMETHDANEGIAAFIERRPARWEADRVAEADEHTEREQTR